MIVERGAGFGLDTRIALMGATGGSIVTAGTGSITIGGASLTGGETGHGKKVDKTLTVHVELGKNYTSSCLASELKIINLTITI